MSKRLYFIISILLMFCLVLGGCGTNADNQDNAAVSDSLKHSVDSGSESGNSSFIGDGKLSVHFIDVGQGDAILIQTPSGQSMLIDAGERNQGAQVVQYLRTQGISKLDILIGTHPHSDHIGGLIQIIKDFPVHKIYLPKVTHNTATFEDLLIAIKQQGLKVSTAKAGTQIPLQGVDACFVGPVGDAYEKLNNYSAVVKLAYGNNSMIFTGDAETESEREMSLSSMGDLKADVLKVGHHGSSSSSSDAFLNAVAPQYAVIMCGLNNDYGHPHKEIIQKLNKKGIEIYRSDQNGNIVMSSDGNTIEIKTFTGLSEKTDNTGYIGNTNSKKFHRAECKHLPDEHNRVSFRTRKEALQAGYSPCNLCRP